MILSEERARAKDIGLLTLRLTSMSPRAELPAAVSYLARIGISLELTACSQTRFSRKRPTRVFVQARVRPCGTGPEYCIYRLQYADYKAAGPP